MSRDELDLVCRQSGIRARVRQFLRIKHAIATNNGTTVLHLALVSLGLQAGDGIIVPSLTYIASANAVRYCGATPLFVDNDLYTFNMDPSEVAAKITPRTRAKPVHPHGHPVDLDPILKLAERHRLFVIEDAAEAMGARYKGQRIGGHGNCATWSGSGFISKDDKSLRTATIAGQHPYQIESHRRNVNLTQIMLSGCI
jgi:dTDP-4-amino-4,6-dideoxygalactose transaminase